MPWWACAGDLITANSFYERDRQGRVKDVRRGHRSRQGTLDMGAETLRNLKDRKCIDDFGTEKQAIKALVDDYLKDPTPLSEKLVLGHTRAEIKALTAGEGKGVVHALIQRHLADVVAVIDRRHAHGVEIEHRAHMRGTRGRSSLRQLASLTIVTAARLFPL